MKKYGLGLLSLLWLVSGCGNVKPEVKATVLSFDASRISCGGSWQIQVVGEQEILRVRGYEPLLSKFQSGNVAVWLTYESDSEQAALGFTQCNFIKIESIRKR